MKAPANVKPLGRVDPGMLFSGTMGTQPGGAKSAPPVELATRLRRLRTDRGWTMDDVSQRTGIARSTISKIENGLMSPTFDVLQKIIGGMQIDLLDFLRPDSPVNPAARRSVTRTGAGTMHETPAYRYEVLATDLSQKDMLPFKATIHARSIADFEDWIRHAGEEFVCVLSGEVEILTEFYAPVRLAAGESIYFDSRMGHALISTSPEDAVVIWVSTGHGKTGQPDNSRAE